ncbi:MAG TPA: DUF1444 family protein [Rhizobiaceae bacterium]|nr:DUF1444 family protein [Rhizobiaceae bacterium]
MGIFSWLATESDDGSAGEKRFADIGAFRDYVMDALRRKPGVSAVTPDSQDPAMFYAIVEEQTWTLDVTNIYQRLAAYPEEDLDETVERFLTLTDPGEGRQLNKKNIVIVIRAQEYVDTLAQKGITVRSESLVGDLAAVFMVDLPDTMSPLIEGEMAEIAPDELRSIAIANVTGWLPQVVADHSQPPSSLYHVEGNTFLSTSLVFIDEFWKLVASKYTGDVLIALPRTDQLFVFDASSPQASEAARGLVDVTFEDGFNLLSRQIYQRRNGKLSVFIN